MKRLTLVLSVSLTMMCGVSFGQSLKLGAAGGIGTTNWVKDFNDAKTRIVFGIGGAAQYGVTDKLSVGAELVLSSIGPKIDDPIDGYFGKVAIPVLQIPLFASYEVIDNLRVHAGFQPAAVLAVNAHIDNEPHEGKYDLSDDYGSFNMDMILGASYDITDNVTAILRLNQGLVDMDTERENREFKSTGFQIGVRYWLFNK